MLLLILFITPLKITIKPQITIFTDPLRSLGNPKILAPDPLDNVIELQHGFIDLALVLFKGDQWIAIGFACVIEMHLGDIQAMPFFHDVGIRFQPLLMALVRWSISKIRLGVIFNVDDLPGCLFSKCRNEYRFRRDFFLSNHFKRPFHKGKGHSRARTSDDQQGAVGGVDGV